MHQVENLLYKCALSYLHACRSVIKILGRFVNHR
uniref:Uncharacterized protein n=1 Tax=Anguilla anguilla TaxID=7936 RepID=A0A0E9XXC5_ANGAN